MAASIPLAKDRVLWLVPMNIFITPQAPPM